MKIEKLKNNHKKKIIIGGMILVGVLSTLILTTTRAKYRTTQSINIVNGTINYKMSDFNLMAVYIKDDSDYITANAIPKSGYTLNTTESYCGQSDGNGGFTKDASITLNYHDGVMGFDNITTKGTKCKLYFDKMPPITVTDIIASVTVKETTPSYGSTATGDEGVYKIADGMYGGHSYVWRGAVKNNWVLFANMYWRIIRINGDESIRLIYTGNSSLTNVSSNDVTATGTGTQINGTTYAYNSSYDRSEYVGYTYKTGYQRPSDTTNGTETSSTIKGIVDTWYNSNIGNNTTYVSKVADGKYCNDRVTTNGSWSSKPSSSFDYAARGRLESSKAPTLSCPSKDVYTLKAGLITADEVSMAGGVYGKENKNYYLYTKQSYWTMSPSYWWSGVYAYVFFVYSEGELQRNFEVSNSSLGVRPVINLDADTVFAAGGNGTFANPFVVQ